MEIYDKPPLPRFAAGTTPTDIEIISEPYIVATRLGYAPMVTIRQAGASEQQSLLIGARTLMTALEDMRRKNEGKLTGLKLKICKEGEERISKYVVQPLNK